MTKYKVKAFCGNCGWRGEVEREVGKTVGSKPCPECGCKTLGRG